MKKLEKYPITVWVKAESEMAAYQILHESIQKRWLRGDWQYKEGVYAPQDFFEESGFHWKRRR